LKQIVNISNKTKKKKLRYTYTACLVIFTEELYLVVAQIFRNLSPSVHENVGKFKITHNPFLPFHRTILVYYE